MMNGLCATYATLPCSATIPSAGLAGDTMVEGGSASIRAGSSDGRALGQYGASVLTDPGNSCIGLGTLALGDT